MANVTIPSWGDIADYLVKGTYVKKQCAMVLLAELAASGQSVDTRQVAKNFENGAKGAYLWSHYLEAVENNSATSTELVSELGALRTQIGEGADWNEKSTVFRSYVEKRPSLMNGFFDYDFSEVTAKLGERFGHLFPEFLPKLSVATASVSSPIRVMADYKEAAQLVQPFVDDHTLSKQAGADYADVATTVKLMQTATMNIDSSMGYPLFREWADKYHVSHDIQEKLDPTDVSKSLPEFAPEA